jgi:hypothetical protein
VGVAQEFLGAPTIGRGECPGKGWWWRESKESNKPPKLPGMNRNSAKTAGFPHFLTYKSEIAVIYLKVLNKIYSQDVL